MFCTFPIAWIKINYTLGGRQVSQSWIWAVRRLSSLIEHVRQDLIWQVEEATQVLYSFIGEVPVVVMPPEVLSKNLD
jgi:hypothetical protein